jgi:hypothetical protein
MERNVEAMLGADGGRIVDIRVTKNPAEVAKYATKPGAYLKLDEDGTWWCDSERLKRRTTRLVADG